MERSHVYLKGFPSEMGPNLARNFSMQPQARLRKICDANPERAAIAAQTYPAAEITSSYEDLLTCRELQAILIATPVSSHFELARQALLAGKDVLIEKPLTRTSAEAEELVALARKNNRVLAIDHTFLFTGAVSKIKEIIDSGDLGEILYFDSVRINLGLFQQDINVLYDLGPHDLSILNYLLARPPCAVQAVGVSHSGNEMENQVYLHLEYEGGLVAHCHWNWLAPVKIRRILICGTQKMIVYDEGEPSEKVKVYDKGIVTRKNDLSSLYKIKVDYRTGDMHAPKLVHKEALAMEAEHFLACVRDRKEPVVSGSEGLKVVRLLEAAQQSLQNRGERIELSNF